MQAGPSSWSGYEPYDWRVAGTDEAPSGRGVLQQNWTIAHATVDDDAICR